MPPAKSTLSHASLFSFLVLFLFFDPVDAVPAITASEQTALAIFNVQTGGPYWFHKWMQPQSSYWGVHCDDVNIIAIRLDQNNLTGAIPAAIASFFYMRALSLAN